MSGDYLDEGARLGRLFLERFRRMTPEERLQTYVNAKILDQEGNFLWPFNGGVEPLEDEEDDDLEEDDDAEPQHTDEEVAETPPLHPPLP